jgi:hypothetical protein
VIHPAVLWTLSVKELLHRAICFADGVAVIHCAGKIGIRKRDSTVRSVAQYVTRRGIAVDAEKESRLWIHIRVTPPIQNNCGDVSTRIEAAGREHVTKLFPECALILGERSAEQLRTPPGSLLGDREPRDRSLRNKVLCDS